MMHLNIFHRPAPGPLYEIFKRQQELVHSMGLKVTLFLHYRDLFDRAMVEDALRYAREQGDEIGLALHDLTGPGLDAGHFIWLLEAGQKRAVLQTILAKYREVFGRNPVSAASYHFDASALKILKEEAPEVETVVGGCFEEGVRVYHGCNHSWHLFNEGMPWNPWYPSATHALRPAADEADAAGVVAVPHLMRDMSLAYEGRNDFWASHPPNIIRGMGNDASFCPYDLNLIDQFRMQEEWNGGYSYYNTFVNASWLTWNHNSEYPPEVAWELYTKFLGYLADLKSAGQVCDMTLGEYGRWHRQHRQIGQPEVYWAREMLYGSGKHYFWMLDPNRRLLIDPTQGGSIGDLRPYIGRVPVATGPDTEARQIGSYPYLIQSQHRTGSAHHYADGARTTLLISNGSQTLDLCTVRTQVASVTNIPGETSMELTPAPFAFDDGLSGEIVTRFRFLPNGGTRIERTVSQLSNPEAELTFTEYLKAAPGVTEYPEDLHGIRLSIDGEAAREVAFDYSGETLESPGATTLCASIPHTCTRLEWSAAEGEQPRLGSLKVGPLFSPYFTLALEFSIKGNSQFSTCLNLKTI
ncbi:MAG: hypothetical protein ACFUZC_04065 [Chthoniobacteraceae bacterium]